MSNKLKDNTNNLENATLENDVKNVLSDPEPVTGDVVATITNEIPIVKSDNGIQLDIDTLVNRKMSTMVFESAVTDTEKTAVESAKSTMQNVVKAYYESANSYIRVCEVLFMLKHSGAYEHIINPNTHKNFTTKEFNNGVFTKMFFDIDKSQMNSNIQIYKDFFNVIDPETGEIKPVMICGYNACEYGKTALQALVTLKPEEREKLENVTPEMTVKEIKKEMEKVHEKSKGTTKTSKHACENMKLSDYVDYLQDAFQAIAKSEDYKAMRAVKVDNPFTGEKEQTLVKYMQFFGKVQDHLRKYSECNIINTPNNTDARK